MRLLLTILSLSLALQTKAAITLVNVENASHFIGIGSSAEEGDSPTVFGGTAGSCSTVDTNSTCNSCLNTSSFEQACNQKRVHTTLLLKITFTSDEATGDAAITDSSGNTQSISLDSSSTTSVSSGNQQTLVVSWSNICNTLLSAGSECETDSNGVSLKIGVDTNGDGDMEDDGEDSTSISFTVANTTTAAALHCDDPNISADSGFCDFEVFPGDEKVFIKQVDAPDTFPTSHNPDFHMLRVYLAEGTDFNGITHANTFIETEFEKDDSGTLTLSNDIVDGLTNGQQYVFRIATVDLAQNQGFHTPITRTDTSSAFHSLTQHSATPSEVRALLNDSFQCFIATAAFGSPFRKNVKVLRDFRDRYLKTNSLGQAFVGFYYQVSPPIARAISQRPWARTLVRYSLLPVVALAQVTLKWGFLPFLFIMMTGIVLLIFTFRRFSKKSA